MTYFDCFTIAAWTFGIGWFIGAIYVQNHAEKTESPGIVEAPEPCPDCDAFRFPVVPGAVAAD